MENSSHQKRIASALHQSRPCFTDQAAERIAGSYPSYGIHQVVVNILNRPQLAKEFPKSLAELASRVAPLFSAEFLQHMQQKCDVFDEVCDSPLPNAFLGQKTYLQWAQLVAGNCVESYLQVDKHQTPQHQYDGAFDGHSAYTGLPTPSHTAASSQAPPPITQVNLRGATIREAWINNPDALSISPYERLSTPQQWSPATLGGAHVFHGTSAHLNTPEEEANIDEALGCLPTKFIRQGGKTQLYPNDGTHTGFYTAFSAMRSYLWVLFLAEVIQDPPGPTPSTRCTRPFTMRGRSYKGILLVRIFSSQPSPSGLSSYVVPSGMEVSWRTKSMAFTETTTEKFWSELVQPIHRQSTPDFPDLVHGREMEDLRIALRPFQCKGQLMWQTAWISRDAINTLNGNADRIFAISFELENQPGPPQKKRKTVGCFVRKASQTLKKALSTKDLRQK